ncbi:agrin-like [Cherax quadricarinatus]|uniref:agrin-like n=1 Tax=Cherax quadricarinatus TaxID=27406 RepID=UPI0023786B33|nr:agrin-like [Cherax quadricarinatus]
MWISKGETMRLLVVLICLLVIVSVAGSRGRRPRRQNLRWQARAQRRRSQTLPEHPEFGAPGPTRMPEHTSVCPDRLTLEEREELANLIFTGRVEWLTGGRTLASRSNVGVEGVAGGVRVKRVFKGGASLAEQVVQVDGLGGWKVCQSRASVRDTHIFLTNIDHHGRVTLNSSLVRLTLKNLRTIAKAVTGETALHSLWSKISDSAFSEEDFH